jgi:hypothetical protein
MAAIGASGFGIWYAAQPHVLNINGPTPLLEFEVKPRDGESVQSLANVEAELDTDRNTMPGYWHTDSAANPNVRAGYCRTLLSDVETSVRPEISWRRRPNFPASFASQPDEGEIPRLVRVAKPGLRRQSRRATYSPLWRKRLPDSL